MLKITPEIKSTIERNKSIPYLGYIDGYVEYKNKIIVRYKLCKEMYEAKDFNMATNIWCLDKETSEQIWVIEKPSINLDDRMNIYSGIEVQGNKYIAYTTHGFSYDLDPETGKISNPVFTK